MQQVARKLAKSNKFQVLYSQYKETGVRIFKNETDLTTFQVNFLQYLSMYSSIMMDIYMGEVSDIVLKDELYEDAYLEYRAKERQKKKSKSPDKPISKNKNKIDTKTPIKSTDIVFRTKNKRN